MRDVTNDEQFVAYILEEKTTLEPFYSELAEQRAEANLSFIHEFTSDTTPKDNLSKVIFNLTSMGAQTLSTFTMKPFIDSKKTVEFRAMDGQLKPAADQAAMMANNVFHQMNRGFDVIQTGALSAAINKNAIWFVEYDDAKVEIVSEIIEADEPLTEEQAEKVFEAEYVPLGWELMDLTENEDYEGSWEVKMKRAGNCINIENVPPEEFMINEGTESIHDIRTRFVCRRKSMYKTDIQAMADRLGVEIDWDNVGGGDAMDDNEYDYEKQIRHSGDDTYDEEDYASTIDGMRIYELMQVWVRADRDEDGYDEWRHVLVVGKHMFYDVEWYGSLPFASFTYFPIPHKFWGQSLYDKIRQYEKIAVATFRGHINTTVLRYSPRWLYNSTYINSNVMNKVTSGFVGVKGANDLNAVARRLDDPGGSPGDIKPIIDLILQQMQGEMGLHPINGVVNADVEKSGNDSVKAALSIDNSSARVGVYQRALSESMKDITWCVMSNMVQYRDAPFVTELAAAVTPETPTFLMGALGLRSVISKNDLQAKVGIGHLNGPTRIAAGQALLAVIKQLEEKPSQANYMAGVEILKGFGYDDPELFLGPLEDYQQKAALAQQSQEAGIAAQQGQAAIAQGQLQQQEFSQQLAMQEFEREQARKDQLQGLEMQLIQAKIENERAQAGQKGADTGKKIAETDEIYHNIGQTDNPGQPEPTIEVEFPG